MYLVMALALFLLAAHRSATTSFVWLTSTVLFVVGSLFVWLTQTGTDSSVAFWYVSGEAIRFAAPAVAGTTLGVWWQAKMRRMRSARQEAERAKQEHADRVADAQLRERARIAQELHDVAGQHLAGLITLADAALRLAPHAPEQALALVAEVRDEGRFAAASLAGALSELGKQTPAGASAVSDLRQLSGLLDYWRSRSISIHFESMGDLTDLPTVISTMAYRSIQESLTNAAKYAPGSEILVHVALASERLSVNVTNGPGTSADPVPGLGLGWGIRGIRDRVALLDGAVVAGETSAGGWELRFEIPIKPTGQRERA